MTILIKHGRVINPASKTDEVMDLLIKDDKVSKLAKSIEQTKEIDKVIDATGCYVMPGLIDLHVHLRDPGLEYKETIATGSKAAARGGFTTVCAMPNTKPATDSKERVAYVHRKAQTEAVVNVLQIGAVTKGQAGEELTDIRGMKEAGAPAISEDGKSVMNTRLYYQAMVEAKKCGLPIFAHCEDKDLVGKGALNKGPKSEEFGVEGICNSVEDIIVARDCMLAKETGVQLHLCHCSTKNSVDIVKVSKDRGVDVTAEVCPHHFTLCDTDIMSADTNYKMNPPLRSREDVEALKQGLKDDIMDVIATDHAPHHQDEKAQSMEKAPFGITGLETAVSLTISELVKKGWLTPMQMAEKMSYNPAKIIGIDKGDISEGKIADVVVINPDEEYVIDAKKFASKGKNTPFNGRKVQGRVKQTIVAGKIVYNQEEEE